MARIQALRQASFTQHSFSPMGEEKSDGVPKFHPLKSSNPVFKASSLIHGLKLKLPKMGLKPLGRI
jgi:hypothetical protein